MMPNTIGCKKTHAAAGSVGLGETAAKKVQSPREAKNKRRSGKNSQEDSEDSEATDVKTKDDSHSAEDSEDEKEAHKNVLQQGMQLPNRVMLMEDVGSGEQEEEDEAQFQEEDSGSDDDFLVEDDEGSDYGSSKKKNKKIVKKSKPERNENAKTQTKGHSDAKPCEKQREKTPLKEEEEPESPPEKNTSVSPPPEKSGDVGSEDEAQTAKATNQQVSGTATHGHLAYAVCSLCRDRQHANKARVDMRGQSRHDGCELSQTAAAQVYFGFGPEKT
ncbi:hypothetical protein GH733_010932, partial [Mirounga leonina]